LIHLLIVASTQALRAGLRSLLSADKEIVITGEAASPAGLGGLPPDTNVILDATPALAGDPSRGDIIEWMRLNEAHAAFLLLSDDPPREADLSDLSAHAWGILPLDASGEELIAAVHALNEGLVVGSPHLLEPLINRLASKGNQAFGGVPMTPEDTQDSLTAREVEVLQLLAQGLANKQIALSLGISEHTVKFHVSSIFAKLGVVNRTEAVRMGARKGLILL
jgi:DNA-binding NarL/FixJ family response regulator